MTRKYLATMVTVSLQDLGLPTPSKWPHSRLINGVAQPYLPNEMILQVSGQISIIPKPELRGFWGSSLIKPPFRVTSADVVIICPKPQGICDG